ncbi:hypothetical protein DZA55_18935 [Xanthomonas oryzae pv. oryzae]|nr:hypothetical protein DZA55_18935 [Xanthomonas oryzae pv. oryzae]
MAHPPRECSPEVAIQMIGLARRWRKRLLQASSRSPVCKGLKQPLHHGRSDVFQLHTTELGPILADIVGKRISVASVILLRVML